MMQAAEPWHRNNPSARSRLAHCFTSVRRSLRKREVRPIVVVIANVFIHEAFQVTLIENDHMVKEITSAGADPALGNAVLPWTSEAGPLWLNAETPDCFDHFVIELRTAIKIR